MSDSKINYNIETNVRDLLRHLSAQGQVAAISTKFSALKTNAERVEFVHKLLEENNLLPQLVRDRKNNDVAGIWRQKGNEMFKAKKSQDAIELYTKSATFAEENSEYLALAYANRSAVLFEKGYYKECLMDISRALENKYPEKLKTKLLERKKKSLSLRLQQTTNNYFQAIPKIPDSNQNESIQCATDLIEIKYTDDQGRHVVAKKDIVVGDVLAIEKPFCHILIEKHFSHCHECLNLCYNLLPCGQCTQALYCGEECKRKAQHYHRYECPILDTTKKLQLDKLKLLSLKIAISVKDQYKTLKYSNSIHSELYKSDRYDEIHNLVANTEKRSTADLFERSTSAAIIFHLVKNYTNFFEDTDQEDIFKEIVLLHLQTGPCNFHEISELSENENKIYELDEIGAGAYSFLSMFNHRCSPNVVRHCYGPVIVVRALETIRRGEQCYDNYGYHHALMEKNQRQEKLRKQYFFDCKCQICENNWPLFQNLPYINTNPILNDIDFDNLQNGDVQTANKILSVCLPKIAEVEQLQPNKNFAELQEVIKQCYALLGNLRKTL